jgi:hypothetical protein
MTAPVIFFMFLNVIAPIIISDDYLTTVIFHEPIHLYSGASESKLFIKKSKNSKMIFLKSLGQEVKTNLNVVTDSGALYSFLIIKGKKPHSVIQVEDGVRNLLFKQVRNVQGVLIEESKNVIRVTNKTDVSIEVNYITVQRKSSYQFCGGAPIFLNGRRVYR